MTAKEMTERKQKLEFEIFQAVQRFSEETGIMVVGVKMETVDATTFDDFAQGKRREVYASMEVRVREP